MRRRSACAGAPEEEQVIVTEEEAFIRLSNAVAANVSTSTRTRI